MSQVNIKGLVEVKRGLDRVAKQLTFATAKALTLLAKEVRKAEVEEMRRVFDRPTPYTLNSLQVSPATKASLVASVSPKEWGGKGTSADKFLPPQIEGTDRNIKRFERALQRRGIMPGDRYAVPGRGAQVDAYGNLSRGEIVKVLSYLQAFGEQGYSANINAKKKAKMDASGKGYFALPFGSRSLAPGIYKREGRGVVPVIMFVKKPDYKKRYDFHGIGRRVVAEKYEQIFLEAVDHAFKTAK